MAHRDTYTHTRQRSVCPSERHASPTGRETPRKRASKGQWSIRRTSSGEGRQQSRQSRVRLIPAGFKSKVPLTVQNPQTLVAPSHPLLSTSESPLACSRSSFLSLFFLNPSVPLRSPVLFCSCRLYLCKSLPLALSLSSVLHKDCTTWIPMKEGKEAVVCGQSEVRGVCPKSCSSPSTLQES